MRLCHAHLPVSNVTPNAQHELLNHSVKDVSQRQERQEAIIRAHPDVPQIYEALKGGHSSHQSVVSQHNTLGVACTAKTQVNTTLLAGCLNIRPVVCFETRSEVPVHCR